MSFLALKSVLSIISPICIFAWFLYRFPITYKKIDADTPFWTLISRLYLKFYIDPMVSNRRMSRVFRENQSHFSRFSLVSGIETSSSRETVFSFDDEKYTKPRFKRIIRHDEAKKHQGLGRTRKLNENSTKLSNLIYEIKTGFKSNILIRGGGGTGKTSLCRFILYHFSKFSKSFDGKVFYLRARSLSEIMLDENKEVSDSKGNIERFIARSKVLHFPYLLFILYKRKLSIGFLRETLKNSLLIIDGLDEISDYKSKQKFLEILESTKEKYECRLILSSRFMSIDYDSGLFRENTVIYDLLPFSSNQIERLSKVLFRYFLIDHSSSSEFVSRIKQNNAYDLASNPFFLTLMAELEKDPSNRLPDSKPALIHKVIQESIHRRKQGASEKFLRKLLILLAVLAEKLQESKSSHQIEESLNEKISNQTDLTFSCYQEFVIYVEKLGFVLVDKVGRIEFSHRCFKEYFLAYYYCNNADKDMISSLFFLQKQDHASDLLYYYCFLQENIDDLVMTLIAARNDKVDLSIAIRLLSIERLIKEVFLAEKVRRKLWDKIRVDHGHNRELIKSALFEFRLNLLKMSDPVSKILMPYSIASKMIELNPAMNKINARVAFLSEEQIHELVENINQKYPCEYGEFTLPRLSHVKGSKIDDIVYLGSKGLYILNPHSDSFKKTKLKIQEVAKKFVKRKIRENEIDDSVSRLIIAITHIATNMWRPDLYFSTVDSNYIKYSAKKIITEARRKINFGDIQSNKNLDALAVFFKFRENERDALLKLANRTFASVLSEVKIGKIKSSEIEKMILISLYSIFNSFRFGQLNGVEEQVLVISYLYGVLMVQTELESDRKFEGWGRIKLCYEKSRVN